MFKLRLNLPTLDKVVARLEAIAKDWQEWRRPTLAEAQRIMRQAVEEAMASGGYPGATWPPRSEVSEKLRPGRGVEGLVRFLREDLTQSTASLRLQFPGGVLLSEGGTTAGASMIGGKSVPARPLMRIPDAAAKRIKERQREALARVGK